MCISMPMLKVVRNFTDHDVMWCRNSPTFVMLYNLLGIYSQHRNNLQFLFLPHTSPPKILKQYFVICCCWYTISVVNRYPEIRTSNFGSDIRIWKCPYDSRKRSANSQGLRSALAAWTPWRESSVDKVKYDTLPLRLPLADRCSNRHLFRLTAVQ